MSSEKLLHLIQLQVQIRISVLVWIFISFPNTRQSHNWTCELKNTYCIMCVCWIADTKFSLRRNYPKERMLVALLQYKQKMSLSDTKRVELIKDWSETVQIMPSWNNNEYFLVSFFIQRETTEDNLWNYFIWKKTQILTYVAPFLIGMLT